MALKDRVQYLSSPEAVDAFVDRPGLTVVLKAGACHQTDEAFAAIAPVLETHEAVPFAVIRVIEARPASNHLAERSGVRHHSPQLLVFDAGRLILARSRWEIDGAALEVVLGEKEAALSGPAPKR